MAEKEYYEDDVVSEEEEEEQEEVVEVEEKEVSTEEDKNPDYIYDQVKGGHGKRHVLADLNKKKLGNHEMDEMFCEWF